MLCLLRDGGGTSALGPGEDTPGGLMLDVLKAPLVSILTAAPG